MCNLEEKITGECCYCKTSIPVSECICKHCLEDLEKEAKYEDYLDTPDYD